MSECELVAAPRTGGEWLLREPPQLEAFMGRLGDEPVVLLEWPTATAGPVGPTTRAEREVLALALAGLSSAEIAARRGRARKTIENQLAAVYSKLGVRSRLQLFACFSVSGGARA